VSNRGSVIFFGTSFLVAILIGLAAGTWPWSEPPRPTSGPSNSSEDRLETVDGTTGDPSAGPALREGSRSGSAADPAGADRAPRTLLEALTIRQRGSSDLVRWGQLTVPTAGSSSEPPALPPPPPGSTAPQPPPSTGPTTPTSPPPSVAPAPPALPTEPAPPPTTTPPPTPAQPPGGTAPPRVDPDHPSNRRGPPQPSDSDDD
jgi:hypothetical protein